MKTCSKCHGTKPLTEFSLQKGRPSSWCKACHREYSRPYRKAYYQANAEAVKEYQQARHEADPGYLKRWREANPEKHRAAVNRGTAKRRAAKTQQAPAWADPAKIKAVYDYATELRARGIDCHVDHIVPLLGRDASGLHTHDNLEVVLAGQNMRKHNKVPADPHAVAPTWRKLDFT